MAVLLVGLGRWGEQHLRVLRQLGEEVWVADVSPARRAWAEQQGIRHGRVVADYREVLPGLAAVDVVTPADSHPEIALASLAAGRRSSSRPATSPPGRTGRSCSWARRVPWLPTSGPPRSHCTIRNWPGGA